MVEHRTTPGITVHGLVRRFEDVEAVRGVSFQVERGSVFGLLGPNGAGKTTTLRMLATLLHPTAGDANIAGFDLRKDPLSIRKNLGYLTGDTGLYGRLSPKEICIYFGKLYAMEPIKIEQRIDELFSALDIHPYSQRRCGLLSTGQRQRVSIARALFHDPPVLILDEPTAGLDIVSSQFILDTLRQERQRGKAILFSTHILAEAELLCDQIGLIDHGVLLETGTVQEVLERRAKPTLALAMLDAISEARTSSEHLESGGDIG
jgi:sodium transport system ATP-binding protein